MGMRHRLLLPARSRSVSSMALSQHGGQLVYPQNSRVPCCALSSASTTQSVSRIAWRGSLVFRLVALSRNFAGRASTRARSTQMRLSQVPLGVGEVALIGEESLGLKEKAELVAQQLESSGESKPEESKSGEGDDDAVVFARDKDLKGGLRRLAGSNIFVGSSLRSLRIKNAEFIKSSPKVSECPREGLPEFAVVGRSNVGKSSLINTMVNRKELAQTSKRPGKTQLINHFKIDNCWYLVDLPGYGFAKAPTAVRTDWSAFTKDYFLNRQNLVAVFLLIDASIPPQKIDLDCANWLGRNNIPMTVVFTKCDRKKKNKNGGRKPEENILDFETRLKESFAELPPWLMTSSATGQGKDELLTHIGNLLQYWKS